ncbi:carboxypeptidase regulatory-like domain-containing protein [Natrinema thermotolerans]|uniref:Carboxypeptidase regulatory-like domain-containing protein n=1 Tax=Natrinema thermotolerans TaxID=121872 RepID=A0AAF0PDH9_9EURY|nr:carboxypeptidase regulatory-like domain-containing protein [Natrinema thermotolerans]WMT09175.1 carboxypeptidase regulatory-like domain-containing protein [Natrinema thermotolerans]
MRRNARENRTETRSIQRSVQILLTVTGIVFLLAGLALAASGASVSSAIGSVSDSVDGFDQPTDGGDNPSDDDTTSGDGDDESDETSDGNGETESGNSSDDGADTGSDNETDASDDLRPLTTVVENRSGEPIDTATVTVDTGPDSSKQESVNGSGEAEFSLADGEYTVTANADGYRPSNETVGVDGDAVTKTLTLEQRNTGDESNSSGTDDDDSETDGHTLSVAVEDENGDAIDNATVQLEEDTGFLTTGETDEKDVGDDGTVEFTALEDGEYTVTASADGFEQTARDVEIDGSDDEITLTLASNGG